MIEEKIAKYLLDKKKVAIIGKTGGGKTVLCDKVYKLLEDKESIYHSDVSFTTIYPKDVFDNEFVDMLHDFVILDLAYWGLDVLDSKMGGFNIIKNCVCGVLLTATVNDEILRSFKKRDKIFDVVVEIHSNYEYKLYKKETLGVG